MRMDEHVVLALVIILFILAFLLEKLINLYGDKRQKNTKKPTQWVYKWLPDKYKPNSDTNIPQRAMEEISGNEEISTKEAEIKPFQFKPKSFTVWNFKGCDIHFGLPNFPGQIIGVTCFSIVTRVTVCPVFS